jgi:membrane-bound serine protease (ClpP class)
MPTTGEKGLIGTIGITKSPIDPSGKVFIHGEYWDAVSDEAIPEETRVEVIAVNNLEIKVKKV